MSDIERATETSSSSLLETVQPFTIEESPGLEIGIHSPKIMDSSTLICTSIGKSPGLSKRLKPGHALHRTKSTGNSWSGTNKLSHNRDVSSSFPDSTDGTCTDGEGRSNGSGGGGSDSDSSQAPRARCGNNIVEDDFATNHSAKSTDSEPLSSGGSSVKTNTNSNYEAESQEESESDEMEADSAPELHGGAERNTTTDGEGGAVQTSESGEQSADSLFANLTEGASVEPPDRPAVTSGRTSIRVNKNELANLIEKAILDFCSSRTVETMRRMFAGVTNDTETLLRDGGRHDDKTASTPHPVTGELVKEGVIIGDIDVFAPRMQKEFILPVSDNLVHTFLLEPGVFRAICCKTRCQVEVTRRLLNRKLCVGGRWHKYMVLRILGPTYKAISNCDILLQKAVPAYSQRKEYPVQAVCRMFLREDVPDNAELYHGFQRTGGTAQRFGYLRLESPYRSTQLRSVGNCPWKFGLFRPGKLAFSLPVTRLCMKHIYPSLGYMTTSNLEQEYQGVNAADRIQTLYDQFQVKRQAALALKRTLTIPVCR